MKDALVGKAEQAALDVPTEEEKASTVNERAGGGSPFARKWHFVWGKDYIDELVAGYHYNDQGVAARNVFLQDANWNVVAVLDATSIFSAWASVGYEPYGEFTYFEDRAVAAYYESQGQSGSAKVQVRHRAPRCGQPIRDQLDGSSPRTVHSAWRRRYGAPRR